MRLGWKQTYATGIPEIDEQHMGLLDLINALDAYRDRRPDDRDVFNALNAMVKYAETHFATEETYMERFKYPNLLVHKRQHIAFLATVFRFAQMLEDKEQTVFGELLAFLRDWYGTHIGGADREYKEYFSSRGFIRPPIL